MANYAGKKGRLYLSTTGSGTASPIAGMTSWSIDNSVDLFDTTSFGATNKTAVQGLPNGTVNFEGLFDDSTINTIDTAASSSDGCKAYLYFSTDLAFYIYMNAWLSYSINTQVGDAIKISGQLAPNSAIGRKLT